MMSKLVKYRQQLNLTQDELSEKSGVSVRTIQRVEAGAKLQGHTLKVIALALDIEPSELINKTNEQPLYNFPLIKLINLSCIFFFIPFAGIIVPLLIMHLKKEKNAMTKQIVSIQIMWLIVSAVTFFMSPFIITLLSLPRGFLLVVLFACILSNIYIILRNTMKIDRNNKLHIQLNFSII